MIFDTTVTTDDSGHFSLPDMARGNYRITIKGANTLAVAQDVTLVGGTNTIDFSILREGDADNSNLVNLTDFSLLATNFGQSGD